MLQTWLRDNDLPGQLQYLVPRMLIDCWDDLYTAGYCYPTPNNMRSAVALQCRQRIMTPPYVTDHPSVKSALEGYRRMAAARIKKRQPIGDRRLEQLIQNMRRICPWVPAALWPLIMAAYRVAYRGFFRISELKGFIRRQVGITEQEMTYYLPTSKSDKLGHGVTVHIYEQRARELLRGYWQATAPDAVLFPLCPRMLNAIIAQTAKALGWSGYFSFHSLRHGAATDFWQRTHDLQRLMAAGRWRTKGAARYYIHDIDAA